MKHIWAPWRIEYITQDKPKECIFCNKPKENNDARNYILHRGDKNFAILNSYPYNPGHLLVAPFRHVGNIEDLSREELHEHIELVSRSVEILKKTLKTEAFNIGINLNRIAGAGIEDHFHSHVVPRWSGDTNAVTVVADMRVVPEALAHTCSKLKGKF